VEISDVQDVMPAQQDGIQMLQEELVSDQFQFALVSKSTQLTVTLAYHAQETNLFLEPTTKFAFQLHVSETPS
jgi:hypothetical protein